MLLHTKVGYWLFVSNQHRLDDIDIREPLNERGRGGPVPTDTDIIPEWLVPVVLLFGLYITWRVRKELRKDKAAKGK